MRSLSPMFDDAVINCVASDRASTVQKLFHVAELIWAEGAADRSAAPSAQISSATWKSFWTVDARSLATQLITASSNIGLSERILRSPVRFLGGDRDIGVATASG